MGKNKLSNDFHSACETGAELLPARIPGLLQKYDKQGPRYTSYPPATEFAAMSPQEYLTAVSSGEDVVDNLAPLSLYIHIPFCQSPCFYCGCNKIITRNRSAVREYLDHLRKEMALIRLQMNVYKRPVTQLHWGGGTPTFLDDAEMTELMHHTASYFNLDHQENRDYSIEVDPRTVTCERIDLLRGLGFNRISLGIQDFNIAVQEAINRVQPFEDVQNLVEYIRARCFRSLNFDLIYGLPLQSVETIEQTLDQVIALSPDRISYYNYAHLPDRFPAQKAIHDKDLPSAENKLKILSTIIGRLTDAGYQYIGMDHFVKQDDPLAIARQEGKLCRNFQGYSVEKADDLVGLGVSAISSVGNVYAQNASQLDGYYQSLNDNQLPVVKGLVLSKEDLLRREIIQQLSCYRRLDTQKLEQKYRINFVDHFQSSIHALGQFERDGLIEWDGFSRFTITLTGSLLLRNICMLFDQYYGNSGIDKHGAMKNCIQSDAGRPAFSRLI